MTGAGTMRNTESKKGAGMRVIRTVAKLPGFALVIVLAMSGCREANEFQPPPPPEVTTAKPVVQTVVTYTEMPGQTRAIESVEVRARVEGFLKTVDFEEGAEVAQGALLYTIEPEMYESAVRIADARLANAKAVLVKAEFDLNRIRNLEAKQSAAKLEVVEAETGHSKANAEVAFAEAGLETAQLDLKYTRVTAPIAGRVNRTEVNVGNLVGRGEQTLLTTIVPWHPIHVYVTVGERIVLNLRRRVAEGTQRRNVPVLLRLADGTDYPIAGKVDYFDNQVDVRTGTARMRAVVDNPDGLLVPGIFVRVRIPRRLPESVLVPESALQRDLTGYYVFTVDESRQVSRADVVTGPPVKTYRSIQSGLAADAEVIIKGLQRIRPGLVVDAKMVTLSAIEQPGVGSESSDTLGE